MILKEIRTATKVRLYFRLIPVFILSAVIAVLLAIFNFFLHLELRTIALIIFSLFGLPMLTILFIPLSPWLIGMNYQKRTYLREKSDELKTWKEQRQKYFDKGADILQRDPLSIPPIPEMMADWEKLGDNIRKSLADAPNKLDELKKERDRVVSQITKAYDRSYFSFLKAGQEKLALEILEKSQSEIDENWNSAQDKLEKYQQYLEEELISLANRQKNLAGQAKDIQRSAYAIYFKSYNEADHRCSEIAKKIELARQLPV